ncbi:hypothetical protein HYPSUDRAFT_204139 [Hypholoma sublateritium FD-334 SS-4]|uniref:Uncharacterized protein n=1 Tax=Hypholoma sublateritium (strain FD-334 SS-4) TaxID=945553 RepID=A0A0D2M968_HYPSF|nr:hypothetical protein HYPSUDRAFT_208711 [Hypholoma sublateritium FD-334 SS-4]KJA19878.1 hypothetical protein HYPSUDRAFT_204139 [Hypholoma sublateritium FD-334 SS-4]
MGGARAAQNPDKPRREAILALAKYADARQVYWRPNGGREGELSHRFFELAMRMLNYNSKDNRLLDLVLDDVQVAKEPQPPSKRHALPAPSPGNPTSLAPNTSIGFLHVALPPILPAM